MTVGERIKKVRISKGMTQEELSELMGYSGKSSVCKAETYGDNITTTKVKKYADALGVSFEYLMGWDDIVTDDLPKLNQDDQTQRVIEYFSALNPVQKDLVESMIKQMLPEDK